MEIILQIGLAILRVTGWAGFCWLTAYCLASGWKAGKGKTVTNTDMNINIKY
jgi:hypothetical protein